MSATPSHEAIDDDQNNLHLLLYRQYLTPEFAKNWWATINDNVLWQRVKYKSGRFGKHCETPCFTAFYGGFSEFNPYTPVPPWLKPLVDQVSELLGVPFNALLLRLYLDGADEIAWHTDGRTFLGPKPTIGSLSLGATANFEMRRMRNVWPSVGPPKDGEPKDDGIDHSMPPMSFALADGDLIVMRGDTQAHWHHRVPKAKSRRPRININFRYILPDDPEAASRGQATYYKYMRDGDVAEPGVPYETLVRRSGSLLGFTNRALAHGNAAVDAPASALTAAPIAVPASTPDTTLPASRGTAMAAADAAHAAVDEEAAQGAPRALSSVDAESSQWACPQCTLLNPPLAPVCAVCDYQLELPGHAIAPCDHESEAMPSLQRASSRGTSVKRVKRETPADRTLLSMWAAGPP